MRSSLVDRSPGACWFDETEPPPGPASRIRRHLWWLAGALALGALFQVMTQPRQIELSPHARTWEPERAVAPLSDFYSEATRGACRVSIQPEYPPAQPDTPDTNDWRIDAG